MIPSIKQFKKWTLPSKSSFIGLVIAIVALVITLLMYIFPFDDLKSFLLSKEIHIQGNIINNEKENYIIIITDERGEILAEYTTGNGNFSFEFSAIPKTKAIIEITNKNNITLKKTYNLLTQTNLGNLLLEQIANPEYFGVRNSRMQNLMQKHVNSSNGKPRILIFPFYEYCDIEDELIDIGYLLSQRIKQIIKDKEICASALYVNNYNYGTNVSIDSLYKFTEAYHVSVVIFGNFFSDKCSNSNDMYCLNYIARGSEEFNFNQIETSNDNWKEFKFLEFNLGTNMEALEYIVEFNSIMSMSWRSKEYQAMKDKGYDMNLPCGDKDALEYFEKRKSRLTKEYPQFSNETLTAEATILEQYGHKRIIELYNRIKRIDSLDYRNLRIYALCLIHEGKSKEALPILEQMVIKGDEEEAKNAKWVLNDIKQKMQ